MKKEDNDENKKVFNITSNDVNKFLKKYNDKITSKDLRTWNANNLLLEYIKLPEIKNKKNPVKKAIEKVAEKLHNTYTICVKSYINPVLVEKLKNKNNI
jgi:DNA topoisomerase-1